MQPSALDFPPLDVGTEADLGRYYQDFGPAVALVESEYHGPLDPSGVPLVRYRGGVTAFNPITAAQYALGLHVHAVAGSAVGRDRMRVVLDRLLAEQTTSGTRSGFWELRFQNPKYPSLRDPWVSALAQGNAVSALLRGWQMFGEPAYLRAATEGAEAMHRPDAVEPATVVETDLTLWYEEYPHPDPIHVLNGHVYALLGVLDLARTSGDAVWDERWRRAADTTLAHLAEYDSGYWSVYDLASRELVDEHYHRNIHIPQLRILGALTGSAGFSLMADRWQGYLASPMSTLRRGLGMRVRGLRKRLGIQHRKRRP